MKLNPMQEKVVMHSGHIVAAAPPGSGKTRVLVERTKRLLRESTGQIRLVTFTRNAAGEMRKRIGAAGRGRVTAATFDSYCLKMARGGGHPVSPPSALQDMIAKQRTIQKLGWKMELEELDEIMAEARSLLDPNTASDLAVRVYRMYHKELEAQDVLDFASIARGVVNEITKPGGSIKPLQAAHLLVDEFQDADDIQLNWVLAHARAGAEVLVVGDDDQAIYSWRGGLGYHAMREVEKQLDAKLIKLDTCYRCRPEIVEHARMLISNNEKRFVKPTRTPRPCGGQVAWWQTMDEKAAAFCIRKYLEHHGWPKFAILARRNTDLDIYEETLMGAEKKILRYGGKSLWATPGAQAALELARGIQDPKQRKSLQTALGWMKFTPDQQRQIQLAIDRGVPLDDGKLGESKSLPAQLVDMVNRNRQALENGGSAVEVAKEIKNFIFDKGSKKWPSYKAAIVAARVLGRRAKRHSDLALSEIATELVKSIHMPKGEEEADGVLATMHAAKGMEWPVVFIIAANDGISPNERANEDTSGDLMEEERRLYFVALTRAEDKAYMISYQCTKTRSLIPSPFIAESRTPSAPLGDQLVEWGVKYNTRLWEALGLFRAGDEPSAEAQTG